MNTNEYSQAVDHRETFPRDDVTALKEYLIMIMYTAKAEGAKIKAAELLGKMIGAFDEPKLPEDSNEKYETASFTPDKLKEYLIMLLHTETASTGRMKAAELLGKMIGAFDSAASSSDEPDEYEFTPLSPDKPEEPDGDEETDEESN